MVGKLNGVPIKKELKTRQATILFKPSVFEAIQKIAHIQRRSVGGLIGNLMEDYASQHVDLIKQFDEEYYHNQKG